LPLRTAFPTFEKRIASLEFENATYTNRLADNLNRVPDKTRQFDRNDGRLHTGGVRCAAINTRSGHETHSIWRTGGGEAGHSGRLGMWLTVNGEFRQKSSTAEMIFDVPTLVSCVSEFMTLLPGDIISTGTPAGVGLGMRPPAYLRQGDVVALGIDGLGTSRQEVTAWKQRN
jgi:hypothetical protein